MMEGISKSLYAPSPALTNTEVVIKKRVGSGQTSEVPFAEIRMVDVIIHF